jgi:hypothetical protein
MEKFQKIGVSKYQTGDLLHKTLKVCDKAHMASYEVEEILAQQVKPHTVAKSRFFPACRAMLRTKQSKKSPKFRFLTIDLVRRRIEDII